MVEYGDAGKPIWINMHIIDDDPWELIMENTFYYFDTYAQAWACRSSSRTSK